ncbi:hypothetical protein [Desulfovibrio sp. SGI.169]|uniref:hypothetical protein n=1 Tax=Desulfovibrio sp. SGI.169 TaxID=3420561 RepID=UPI003D01216E
MPVRLETVFLLILFLTAIIIWMVAGLKQKSGGKHDIFDPARPRSPRYLFPRYVEGRQGLRYPQRTR